jgi:polar amino acid transport system substrate-binding protein
MPPFCRLFSCLVFCATPWLARADATLRVRADSWMPFNGDPADKQPGYVVEIAKQVFGPRTINVDYQTLSWDEALKAARAGEIDAVIGANKIEAAELVVPKEPIGAPTMGLFARKDLVWEYANIGSLKKVRLGVIGGYSYWDALDAYIANHPGGTVVVFSGDSPLEEAMAKLEAGEIDVIAETVPVFVWRAKAHGKAMAEYRMPYKHEGEPIYLAFADGENGRRYAAIFDESVRALRKSGELRKILSRYGVADWAE